MRTLATLLLTINAMTAMAPAQADAPTRTAAVVNFNTCEKPLWPREALRKEQTGTVVLGFLIGEDGKVIDAIVRASSGVPSLDEAALKGIVRCHFTPQQINGVPVSGWTQVRYVWTLETKEQIQRTLAEADTYRAAAMAGDTGALYQLARVFRYGVGVRHDETHYLALLRSAAERGYADAEAELAANYWYGQGGVAKDQAQARAWYEQAASHGNAGARLRMGDLLSTGEATPADLALAAEWYRQAAEQGNHVAEEKLGVLYERGRGLPQDYAAAAAWYRKAAEAGLSGASYRLGELYLRGQGVPRDAAQAAPWLNQAAALRQPSAEAALANLYFSGAGVPQSDAEGVKYLRRAAIASNLAAMRQLGQMLAQGSHVAADPAEAAVWLDKVARLGSPVADGEVPRFGDW